MARGFCNELGDINDSITTAANPFLNSFCFMAILRDAFNHLSEKKERISKKKKEIYDNVVEHRSIYYHGGCLWYWDLKNKYVFI